MAKSYYVTLECGHSFTEYRPDRLTNPVDDELRVCGSFEHYPNQYPAKYRHIEKEYDESFYPLAEQ